MILQRQVPALRVKMNAVVTVYGVDQANPSELFSGVKLSCPVQYYSTYDDTRLKVKAKTQPEADEVKSQLVVRLPKIGDATDDDHGKSW